MLHLCNIKLKQNNLINTNMTSSIKIRDEWRALNVEINQQLKRAGKPLNEMPESEWKNWIIEKMEYRDSLTLLIK